TFAVEPSRLAHYGKAYGAGSSSTKAREVESGEFGSAKVGRPVVVSMLIVVAKAGPDSRPASSLSFEREVDPLRWRCGARRGHADEREQECADKSEKAVHGRSPFNFRGKVRPFASGEAFRIAGLKVSSGVQD